MSSPRNNRALGTFRQFDFAIAKFRRPPERILQAINRPTRETALTFISA